jgi:hypothetical protein
MKRLLSYCSAVAPRNEAVEDILAEAASRECTSGANTAPEAGFERGDPLGLGCQRRDGLGDCARVEAALLEVMADGLVAVAALRQRRRTRACETGIVEETDPAKHGDRLQAMRRPNPTGRQPVGEFSLGAVTDAQRTCGNVERFEAAPLASQYAGLFPLEVAALGEAGPDDSLERQGPPGRAVELDRDAVAPDSERGDDGHCSG